jgi:hypothetical protein
MGATETAGTPCSASEQLRGNHSQGPHHDRIAHGFDEPGLRAHLLFHDVGMLLPGIIGDPCVGSCTCRLRLIRRLVKIG